MKTAPHTTGGRGKEAHRRRKPAPPQRRRMGQRVQHRPKGEREKAAPTQNERERTTTVVYLPFLRTTCFHLIHFHLVKEERPPLCFTLLHAAYFNSTQLHQLNFIGRGTQGTAPPPKGRGKTQHRTTHTNTQHTRTHRTHHPTTHHPPSLTPSYPLLLSPLLFSTLPLLSSSSFHATVLCCHCLFCQRKQCHSLWPIWGCSSPTQHEFVGFEVFKFFKNVLGINFCMLIENYGSWWIIRNLKDLKGTVVDCHGLSGIVKDCMDSEGLRRIVTDSKEL